MHDLYLSIVMSSKITKFTVSFEVMTTLVKVSHKNLVIFTNSNLPRV